MPDIDNITPNRIFGVRTFKRTVSNRWVNNYELQYTGSTAVPDVMAYLTSVVNKIRDFELSIHLDVVILERIVISSIERDSTPYNPETFAVFNIDLNGLRTTTSAQQPVPLSFCILAKRMVNFGRAGNILFRGAIRTTDGTITPEGYRLLPAVAGNVETALNTLRGNLITADQTRFVLAKLNKQTGVLENVRSVVSFTVRDFTTTKKLYNRYFDIP